jgi:hypothetical protein
MFVMSRMNDSVAVKETDVHCYMEQKQPSRSIDFFIGHLIEVIIDHEMITGL